ncbi:hypothetical protein EB796_019755 [Bugula neritina]|uniref:Uncharacterized protein n=1 Tax=Bugula neritina TaxID=10212 RepID=A0A7J7J709_BUGNE|nr:hypothetical protein EB796_019755 [Bugula neritina]
MCKYNFHINIHRGVYKYYIIITKEFEPCYIHPSCNTQNQRNTYKLSKSDIKKYLSNLLSTITNQKVAVNHPKNSSTI